ncbi:MAG: hypothetical protein V3T08_09870 [Gemmatimonadota bacterium]
MTGHPWAWGNVNETLSRHTSRQSVYHNLPRSMGDAHALLTTRGGRKLPERSIGYATRVQREPCGSFAVVHHSTAICRLHLDGSITVDTGGWHSQTTKQRVNRVLDGSPWSIGSDRGTLYWWRGSERFCEFEDGDRVFLEPGKPGQDGVFCHFETPGAPRA